jgi:NADH-quinone oxidoreductase subunit L
LIDLPFVNTKLNFLDRWLEPSLTSPLVPVREPIASSFGLALLLSFVALSLALVGIYWGGRVYRNGLAADGADPGVERLGAFAPVLEHAYYLDSSVAWAVSHPITWFANFLNNDVDHKVIDGSVNGIATGAREAGTGLRRIQTGLVRNYALAIVFGTVALLIFVATRASL